MKIFLVGINEFVLLLYEFGSAESIRRFENDIMILAEGGMRQSFALNDPVNGIDLFGLSEKCCQKKYGDCFANCVEKERFDLRAVLGTAMATFAVGTMPKTAEEIKMGAKIGTSQNPEVTSQLSR